MPQPLNNYLRTFRQKSGLSQDEIAFLLGTESGTRVSRYECGKHMPRLEVALALAAIYGTSVEELFRGACQSVESIIRNRAHQLAEAIKEEEPSRTRDTKLAFLASCAGGQSEYGESSCN